MSVVTWSKLPKIREVAAEMQPYWQRTVFEVNPELAFFTLNGDHPLQHGKRTHRGQSERRALLEPKLPGIAQVLDARVKGVTEPVNTGEMRLRRRISSTFKDVPGGQILGPTFDYTHRLLDSQLADGFVPETPATRMTSPLLNWFSMRISEPFR